MLWVSADGGLASDQALGESRMARGQRGVERGGGEELRKAVGDHIVWACGPWATALASPLKERTGHG